MTKEDKELLLKDLYSRIMYRPFCDFEDEYSTGGVPLCDTTIWMFVNNHYKSLKPYLRRLSSMTDEERRDLNNRSSDLAFDAAINASQGYNVETCAYNVFFVDWLNEHHFDYRGLIDKDLAIEAPADMYYN